MDQLKGLKTFKYSYYTYTGREGREVDRSKVRSKALRARASFPAANLPSNKEFPDVPLAFKDYKQIQVHKVILVTFCNFQQLYLSVFLKDVIKTQFPIRHSICERVHLCLGLGRNSLPQPHDL